MDRGEFASLDEVDPPRLDAHSPQGARRPRPAVTIFPLGSSGGGPQRSVRPAGIGCARTRRCRARGPGTEVGVTEPSAAFSACFGAPFMAQKPSVYAKLLAEKMRQYKTRCILLNTGWSGGPAGTSKRMSIRLTRTLLNAALDGKLDQVETETHPILNLKMPKACPGVDDPSMLNPRNTWQDKAAYDAQAVRLRDMFRQNFEAKGFAKYGIEPRI